MVDGIPKAVQQHRTPKRKRFVGRLIQGRSEHWMLDVGCWMLDVSLPPNVSSALDVSLQSRVSVWPGN